MHTFGTDINLNRNQAKDFRLENSLSFPTVGGTDGGLTFYHSGLKKFYGWDTVSWIDLGASGGGGSYTLPTATTLILGGVKIDGTTITIDGNGVISSPNSGLEAINEGNGIGWRLIGKDPADVGNIGYHAIDMGEYYGGSPTTEGALATLSFIGNGDSNSIRDTSYGAYTLGGGANTITGNSPGAGALGNFNSINNGYGALVAGAYNIVSTANVGGGIMAWGHGNTVTGEYPLGAIGLALVSNSRNHLAVGVSNTIYGGSGSASDRPIFTVGIGTHNTPFGKWSAIVRRDGFKVLADGKVIAPEFSIAEIDAEATGKALVTKEWVTTKYGSGTLNLQEVTDVGAVTTNSIDIEGTSVYFEAHNVDYTYGAFASINATSSYVGAYTPDGDSYSAVLDTEAITRTLWNTTSFEANLVANDTEAKLRMRTGGLYLNILCPTINTTEKTQTFQDANGTIALLSDITTPTLQQVLDTDNGASNQSIQLTTGNTLGIFGTNLQIVDTVSQANGTVTPGMISVKTSSATEEYIQMKDGYLGYRKGGSWQTRLKFQQPVLGFDADITFPNRSATAVLSVNNVMADTDGDITITAGGGAFEVVDQGNGNGIIKVGRNETLFTNIGEGAVNLSEGLSSPTGASGKYSLTAGSRSSATNQASISLGQLTIASGFNAFATGNSTIASGSMSTAMGSSCTASGNRSFAIGWNNKAPSYHEMTVGAMATDYTPSNSGFWVATDRLFVVGNGDSTRSDAFTILKNGKVGVGINNFETTASSAILQVGGEIETTVPIKYATDVSGSYDNRSLVDKEYADSLVVAASYTKYTVLLNQTGTAAPVATVLENNLGTIVWTRTAPGVYLGTLTGAFTLNKTWFHTTPGTPWSGNAQQTMRMNRTSINTVDLIVLEDNTAIDNGLSNVSIEIRIYN